MLEERDNDQPHVNKCVSKSGRPRSWAMISHSKMETQHPRRRRPLWKIFIEYKKKGMTVKYERSMKAAHSLLNVYFSNMLELISSRDFFLLHFKAVD